MEHLTLPEDLGDGLVLRRSTRSDAGALAEFNGIIHREPGVEAPDEGVIIWTRDLLERPHPTFGEGDFTIVEEKATGRIVSSCNLISQTWSYAGIPFGVGRPELVGTLPEYRKRGLIRKQFDVLHQWSAERGELAQAITGIPFYYRQFGYEMTVDLGGGRIGSSAGVPRLKEGQADPYRLRPATEADVPLLMQCDARLGRTSLLMCEYDEALWRYEICGKSEGNGNQLKYHVIESVPGEGERAEASRPVGVVGTSNILWGTRFGARYVELLPGVSWLTVAPSILRGLWAIGEQMAAAAGRKLESVQYTLGSDHPFYRVNPERLAQFRRPYAWYLRVPDLPAFMRRIAPVLEERMANSLAEGHTGELKLSFYRDGLRMAFEHGRLREIESWQPDDSWHIGFPGLTFLQVLFGHRSVDELRAVYADCLFNQEEGGKALLEVLFPKQGSQFWPLA